jgi:hypothetical protein
MTDKETDPASVSATEGEARKSDQLASEIDSEKNTTANANQAQLISAIKAHIAAGDKLASKADDHYISAGQYLARLKKEHAGNWAEWERAWIDRLPAIEVKPSEQANKKAPLGGPR